MLSAAGRLSYRDVEFAPAIALERSFRLFTVQRRSSLWDTRFVRVRTEDGAHLHAAYFLLDGWVRFHGPGMPLVHGPAGLVASSPPLDGPVGKSRLTLTAGGEPFTAVQLSVASAYWAGPASEGLSPIACSTALIDRARALFAADANERAAPVAAFLEACVDAGIVKEELVRTVVVTESPTYLRTWKAITESYLTLTRGPSRQELSSRVGVSERQLSRDINEMLATFGMEWKSLRELTSEMRLRWAVLLLSSENIPIAEVARAAAYGSNDALDRALRDAGLPSPRDLRRRMLEAAI